VEENLYFKGSDKKLKVAAVANDKDLDQDFPRKLRLISLSEPSYRWSSGIVEPPLASVAGLRASTAA